MNVQQLFGITFTLAIPFWALMILLPRWRWTERIVSSPWMAVPPLVIYLAVTIPIAGDFWRAMTSPDLPLLQTVFGTPNGAAALWAHLISFDLLVARFMYLDSRERGIHPLVLSPILFVTIFFSPIGFLAYLVMRAIAGPRAAAGRPPSALAPVA